MGYDFNFMRWPFDTTHFPCRILDDYAGPPPAFTALNAIRNVLVDEKGFRPNGPSGEQDRCYWWDTPDGGSLSVTLRDDWISVDTHAHWRFVLELYEWVRELHRDVVIADLQTGNFYDATSYAAFIRESYQTRDRAGNI